MHIRLTIPPALLRELHWLLLDAPEGIRLSAGLARSADQIEFLLPGPTQAGTPRATVRAFLLPAGLEGCSHLYWHAMPQAPRSHPHLELALHHGRGCSAAAFIDGRLTRVDEVWLAGPGMDRWVPGVLPKDLRGEVPADGLHSRYAGALGGLRVHERLCQVPCLGIASARLGSALAIGLAKAGCSLVIADPDQLEAHSLDAIEAFTEPVGTSKVAAVARFAAAAAPWTKVTPLPCTADAPAVLTAARNCRLIFSAPDRDDARFAAALLAVAMHRVHVDLGTGVFESAEGRWRAGADIRLLLPGEGVCALCVGGLDLQSRPPADWRRQRAGSLRSLNHLASNAAQILIERLVVGDLQHSVWTRIEVAPDGTFTTRQMPVVRRQGVPCDLCRWAGVGDAAFEN